MRPVRRAPEHAYWQYAREERRPWVPAKIEDFVGSAMAVVQAGCPGARGPVVIFGRTSWHLPAALRDLLHHPLHKRLQRLR